MAMFKIASSTITHLTHDSRTAQHGSCFFVLNPDHPNTHPHGSAAQSKKPCIDNQYHISQAIANGAVLLIAERDLAESIPTLVVPNVRKAMSLAAKRFNNDICDKMDIIAVIGTNGKTTTTHMMKHIIGSTAATIGTLGPGVLTTPDPIELHEFFAKMYADGIRTVCMEVSAHAIHYYKTFGIHFKAAIFTNITQDHLDFFPSFEAYAKTKMDFFTDPIQKAIIINTDDKYGKEIIQNYGKITQNHSNKVLENYSLNDITNLKLNITESTFTYQKQKFRINLPARFNVYNALACIKTARILGIPWKQIQKALSTLPQIRGRFNVIPVVKNATIIIDFAHTPDGLEKLLTAVRDLAPNHAITTVFGCGGNRDKTKREIMGKIAANLSDKIIITSDNPRYESPRAIMLQIEQGVKTAQHKNYTMVENRREAIRTAIENLLKNSVAYDYGKNSAVHVVEKDNPKLNLDSAAFVNFVGEVVVIAGRGGETHQEINGKLIEFCDEKVVKEYMYNYIKNHDTTQNRM